ncbi:2'-5' RNA ligase family protein [Pseudokineococcus sp. 5B2Z-1]|uniref:2'-5' RNA ligase family protein n=1 Tax=Pseudokineococcus sp. 5B2Z-1 TaxID=3132744 RepID=UPI0030B2D5C0
MAQPTSADLGAEQTAVLALVPVAEPSVARHRARLDPAARRGVPAHVTVLYPFMAPDDVDDQVLARLAAAVRTVAAFDVAFTRTAWFGRDVLWLAPEPAQPFRDVIAAVVRAFPDYPPYAGVFDGSAPHLTIGHSRLGSQGALERAEADVVTTLPVHARVERVHLLVGADAPGSWSVAHDFPLA